MMDVSSKIRHWCAKAERSPLQVRRKLSSWGVGEPHGNLIDQLVEEGYIDVRRFAEAFAVDHVRLKGWGPGKVAAALRVQHGLSDSDVEAACAAVAAADIEHAARKAVVKRWMTHPEESAGHTVGALMRRGFDVELARRAVEAEVDARNFEAPC